MLLVALALVCIPSILAVAIYRWFVSRQPSYDEAPDLRRADDAESEEMPDARDIWIAARGHAWPPPWRRRP